MPQHSDPAMRIDYEETMRAGARIKVVGVGGGGNNAVNRMIEAGVEGVEFISVNTDVQPLENSKADVRLQLGMRLTRGLGTGANPDMGRRAALEDSEKIIEALDGADLVFVTAGLGGGTGTGAAPVIAALASQMDALTVAIVTRPFGFEGKRRMSQAERGVQELLDHADTLIVIPNDKLLAVARDIGFFDSFRIADDVLRQAVQGITEMITVRGVINRDLADVRTTMAGMGFAVMGTATGTGPNRAVDAATAAITSPLIEAGAIDGARGILINISGSSSLKLSEVSQASTVIQRAAHEDANIIFGAVLDERLKGDVKVTVIATGFREDGRDRTERRLHMLNRVERPVVGAEDAPLAGTLAPDPPDVPVTLQDDGETTAPIAESVAEVEQTLIVSDELIEEIQTPSVESLSEKEEEVEEAFSDAPERYFTNEWFDDDLLAKIDGPAFDPEVESEAVAAASQSGPQAPPEIVRLRQAAIAAYAATSRAEDEEEDSAVSTEATFAEIMASRARMLEAIDTGSRVQGELLDDREPVQATDDLAGGFLNTPVFRKSIALPREPEVVDRPAPPVPSGQVLRKESTAQFDELDLPAFLRRSP